MAQRFLWMAATAALGLAVVGCGGSSSKASAPAATSAAGSSIAPAPTAAAAAMQMQPGAEKMKVSITSPQDGARVTDNSVRLQVVAVGYDLTCDLAGKPVQEGKGHYHVEIDKSLVDMYCTPQATISMQNMKPGTHTISVIPAQNNHAEVEANAASIKIDYQPAKPLPEIKDATFSGKPSIKIVSPKAGDTVSGTFDVVVEVQNFNLSSDLFGKPGVAGYGHWHLNLDSTSGPMMGMGTMAGMSGTKTFKASTAGLQSGSTHTLIALLVDNGHAPFPSDVSSKVDVKIK